jgi:pimeloyl-ACP methyl ester carboxylesterase
MSFVVPLVLIPIVVFSVLAPIGILLGVGQYTYNRIYECGRSRNACFIQDSINMYQAPNNFTSYVYYSECPLVQNMNMSQYHISLDRIEQVSFPPLDSQWHLGNLSAWLYNYDNFSEAPTVITVHGIRGCKRMYDSILPSSMLFRHGYNILSIDLRNHGDSPDVTPPDASFGNTEYKDVMGAIDYLIQRFGLTNATKNIGLFGVSMGGAVSVVTFQKDDRIRALFVDSAACDVYSTLTFNVKMVVGPLTPTILGSHCTIRGSDSCAPFPNDPLRGMKHILNSNYERAVHFDHCYSDRIVPLESSMNCIDALKQSTTKVSHYFGNSTMHTNCDNHVILMLTETEKYEERLVGFFDQYLK